VDDPVYAVTQLAQTAMRSELGKMTLDQTFKERQTLNDAILRCIGAPAASWGVQVLRYEIRDIQAPTSVREAMDKQVPAPSPLKQHTRLFTELTLVSGGSGAAQARADLGQRRAERRPHQHGDCRP